MAPVCGIPADTIRRVARRFATARAAMIFWGMGVSQHVHGTDNVRCLIALALACGQVGRPGAGLHPLRGQNNVQGASDSGLIPMFYPDYRQVTDPAVRQRFEGYWGATLDPRRGLTVVEMIDAANAGTLRGMYIMGENPAMSDPDLTHARAGLATLDHLVVQDLFLTETAMLADVVLPASALPEKDGTFTNTDRRVQMGRAAVPPPGQARQDLWIIQELARRLGLDWSYAGPRAVFDEMLGCLPSWRGLDWERLERDGAVTYPLDPVTGRGREILFGDGFPMPGGKARLIPAAPLPPDEIPDHDYPLVLTTGRLLEHWHTGAMTRRAAALDQLEPAALVMASPPLLARLGVKSGEMVRVATRRGTVEVAARADAALPDDLLFMPFCFAEGAANMLTNPALDPFARIPELKYCAARLEQVRNNG